ncbi:MAG: PaaI family thioesterase [Dehalococcoidia bacterium]
MDDTRRGPLWDAAEGRAPMPPAEALLGWRAVRVEPGSGESEIEFDAREDFYNPAGNIQGGILAAMLDDTMGPAAVALIDDPDVFLSTIEMKVSFIKPARAGKLTGHGRVVHRGRSIVFMEGRLVDAEGELIATATASARIVPMRPVEHAPPTA